MIRKNEVEIYRDVEEERVYAKCEKKQLPVYQRLGWTSVDDGDSETDLEQETLRADTTEEDDAPVATYPVADKEY